MDYDVSLIGEIRHARNLDQRQGRGARHQPVPLFQEDFRVRRPQPAFPTSPSPPEPAISCGSRTSSSWSRPKLPANYSAS